MSLRVAQFVQRYPPALGGSEAFVARLSRYLADQGDRVAVYTSNALDLTAFWRPDSACTPSGSVLQDDIEVRRYPLWRFRGRRYLLKALSLFPHLTWQCLTMPCNPISWSMWRDAGTNSRPFDVVHASAFPYAWPIACARRLAQSLGIPLFVTPFVHVGDMNDPNDRTRRQYTTRPLLSLLHSAHGIFVQTDRERRVLIDHGIDPARLIRLGMGVDESECTGGRRRSARKTWGVANDESVVGHLANQSVEKGTVDLLLAMERLHTSCPKPVIVLAGKQMPNFENFMRGHRPTVRVVQLGVLDDQARSDFFAGIDMFALPSRSDSFGLVILEAWANGVPTVAYDAGGIGEVIRDGEDGLLAPCGNLDALARCVSELVQQPDTRRRLGASGHSRIDAEFRWEDKLELVRESMVAAIGGTESMPYSTLRTD